MSKMGSNFLFTLCVLGAGMGVISCGGDDFAPGGDGVHPDSKTEAKWLEVERPMLGIVKWNQADSTFTFPRYNNSGVILEKWVVSASKKAVGGRVNLNSPILNPNNLLSITRGTEADSRSIEMTYPDPMGVKLFAEGSNSSIAQSTNDLFRVKTMSYLDCSGLLVENVKSLQQVQEVFANQALEWKLIATPISQVHKLSEATEEIFNVRVAFD